VARPCSLEVEQLPSPHHGIVHDGSDIGMYQESTSRHHTVMSEATRYPDEHSRHSLAADHGGRTHDRQPIDARRMVPGAAREQREQRYWDGEKWLDWTPDQAAAAHAFLAEWGTDPRQWAAGFSRDTVASLHDRGIHDPEIEALARDLDPDPDGWHPNDAR
jgi:hypothetical protein